MMTTEGQRQTNPVVLGVDRPQVAQPAPAGTGVDLSRLLSAKRRRAATDSGRGVAKDSMAFCPPLIITQSEIDEMFDRFAAALDETEAWVAKAELRR